MTTTTSGKPMGLMGRLGMTLFCGVFLAAGLFFFFFLASELVATLGTYCWKETPATIVSSSVVEGKGDDPFSVAVSFRYQWQGRTYTSDRYLTSSESYSDYAKASGKIASLPPGTVTHCYVDPKDPSRAILQRKGFVMAFFLLIPLVFIVVGGGGIVGAWRSGSARPKPLSSGGSTGRPRGIAIIGGLLFATAGGALLFLWYIPSLSRSLASSKWTETPCKVISSRVKSHSDSDGTTYSVDIFYSYKVHGKEYKSNTYGLFGGSSSGYKSKAKVVAKYPPGSQQVCFVNPDDPAQAALKPGLGWEALFGLIPLVFLGVGIAIFLSAFRKPMGMRVIPVESLSLPAASASAGAVSHSPKAKAPPGLRLFGVLVFALVWNGIISIFLLDVIGGFRTGLPNWFLALFLVPFVLIGLGSLVAVGYSVMALANPRCRLNVSPPVLQAGQMAEVAWTMTGSVGRVQRLRIILEGYEEAVYQRGTSTCTDRLAFARILIADVSNSLEMAQGEGRVRIPDGVPPSFNAPKNKIIWALKVHGEIPHWPDVLEEFEVAMTGGKP